MSVIYTKEGAKYLNEITKIMSTPVDGSKKKRRAKNYEKLYKNDTSFFEPIPENREHLINCLMPLVVRLSTQRIKTYGLNYELSDVLSAGFQGAILATDIYIEKSKKEKQPAKLSTYAYSYILKYINEFLYKNQSILSFGPTKGREVREKQIYRGNAIGTGTGNNDFKEEYFETSGEIHLMTVEEHDCSDELSDELSFRLFNCLSSTEKQSLFMFFGIGYSQQFTIKQIASKIGSNVLSVEKSLEESINKMRDVFQKTEHQQVYEILKASNLYESIHWKKSF